jgi:cytochrome c551/c552
VSKIAGLLPFSVNIKAAVSDPEKDPMIYIWNFGNGSTKQTTQPDVDFTYTVAGDYKVSVEVKDDKGASSKSKPVSVYAGNEYPTVGIRINGNKTFYFPGKPVSYDVSVNLNKKDDSVDLANLFVSAEFLDNYKQGFSGYGAGETFVTGKILTQTLDCKSCHGEVLKSVGPSFMMVSEKYGKQKGAAKYLTEKVMKGGSGVWGDVAMSAHPDINQGDLKQIIDYVLSLSNKNVVRKSLALSGTILPPASTKKEATLVLSASYSSKGANNVKALSDKKAVVRYSGYHLFTGKENKAGFQTANKNNINYLRLNNSNGWFAVDSIDLSGIVSIRVTADLEKQSLSGFNFEIRLDSSSGKLLGKGYLPASGGKVLSAEANCAISPVTDGKFHSVYLTGTFDNLKAAPAIDIRSLTFN